MDTNFNRDMLPICGVVWRRFDSLLEAKSFAAWAEAETQYSERPCATCIFRSDDGRGWEVKVKNND